MTTIRPSLATLFVIVWMTAPVAFCSAESDSESLRHPDEVRFGGLRQLTFGGENAEAY